MKHRLTDSKAFTLVELLVAMAVGAILLLATVSMFNESSRVTRQTNSALQATAAASAAVDLIATDLESLATFSPGTVLEMIPKTDLTAFGDYGELFFLSIAGSENQTADDHGQVRAIAYVIIDADPIREGGPNLTPGLYRIVLNPDLSFSDFIGQEDLADAFASHSASLDDFLVGDVCELKVRFFTADSPDPQNESNGALQAVRIAKDGTSVAGAAVTGEPWVWAEVSIAVLENRDDILIRLRQGTFSETERGQLIDSHSRRLTRRIPLRNRL